MAYLVDEKSAARSRNHPTKVKAAKRAADKAARRQKSKQERASAYSKKRSGPVVIYRSNAAQSLVGFYDTQEWKDLRYKVLKRYGAICQCCGATRQDGVSIHVDHIKPRSRFPSLELQESNLQVLCEPCNMGKRAQDLTDWR